MALVAIMATFVSGELVIPGLLGPTPLGMGLAGIEQTLALIAIAAIGIDSLAAELHRLLDGLRHPKRRSKTSPASAAGPQPLL